MKLPNTAGIEIVEGCNLMCKFCGIWGIWKEPKHRKIKFMENEFAVELSKEFGKWFDKKRIEICAHGEPTLHPNLHDIVASFRKYCKNVQLQVTTNGLIVLQEGKPYIEELFKAGLNFLLVDTYTKRQQILQLLRRSSTKVYDYYDKDAPNVYHYNSNKIKSIIVMEDLKKVSGRKVTRVMFNMAGNSNPRFLRELGAKVKILPLKKTCSRLFREIVVHYDGTVPLCCVDWKHEFIVGQWPRDGHLWEIWNSRIFDIMRVVLQSKDRTWRPCYKCDYGGGFRLGLLPKVEPFEFDEDEIVQHLKKMHRRGYPHENATDNFKHTPKPGVRSLIK